LVSDEALISFSKPKNKKMKKLLFVVLSIAIAGAVFAFGGKSLVGHWNAKYGNGPMGTVTFKANGTYEAVFTGQGWKVGGKYKQEGSTASITDSVCGFGYWAKYSASWAADGSVSFKAVSDTCSGRKANADGMVLTKGK
jgi:hypothetical protein